MAWSLGWDNYWGRDIGYGVPAYCDYPGCMSKIDRGLSYVCGAESYGGEVGCGLFFCDKHHNFPGELCVRCYNREDCFGPTPDHPDWIKHKATDPSWAEWRKHESNAS